MQEKLTEQQVKAIATLADALDATGLKAVIAGLSPETVAAAEARGLKTMGDFVSEWLALDGDTPDPEYIRLLVADLGGIRDVIESIEDGLTALADEIEEGEGNG